jgi:hypothetical protein
METAMTTLNTTTQQMTAEMMSMTMVADPYRQNPIIAAVADIRAMQDDLTPRQREIRENGRRRVDALIASGLYGPVYS